MNYPISSAPNEKTLLFAMEVVVLVLMVLRIVPELVGTIDIIGIKIWISNNKFSCGKQKTISMRDRHCLLALHRTW